MKLLLKLEELGLLLFSIYLFTTLDFEWWWYLVLFLTPDIGMLGYVFSTSAGAFTYNLLHHKGIGFLVVIAGYALPEPYLLLAGSILLGHSAFDRILGYGLKYSDSFQHTHLGYIGKERSEG